MGGFLAHEYLFARYGFDKAVSWWAEWGAPDCDVMMTPGQTR